MDELKIDKSFVMGMARDPSDAVIVRSTVDLAHNMGLAVVARAPPGPARSIPKSKPRVASSSRPESDVDRRIAEGRSRNPVVVRALAHTHRWFIAVHNRRLVP